jgi:hypothetical protein
MLHIGEKIRARAKDLRVGPTELARQIKTSKQNVYGIYRRASIDTELLQKLSRALEFDFFAYYASGVKPEKILTVQETSGNRNEELASLRRELQDMREKYELLRALYESKTGEKVPGT